MFISFALSFRTRVSRLQACPTRCILRQSEMTESESANLGDALGATTSITWSGASETFLFGRCQREDQVFPRPALHLRRSLRHRPHRPSLGSYPPFLWSRRRDHRRAGYSHIYSHISCYISVGSVDTAGGFYKYGYASIFASSIPNCCNGGVC